MRTAEDYIDSVLQYMPPGTPLRKQIALELRGHLAEREANGQSVEEIARLCRDQGWALANWDIDRGLSLDGTSAERATAANASLILASRRSLTSLSVQK